MILKIILVHWTTDNNYHYYRNKWNKCCSILLSFKVFFSSMMSWSVCASIQFISRNGQKKKKDMFTSQKCLPVNTFFSLCFSYTPSLLRLSTSGQFSIDAKMKHILNIHICLFFCSCFHISLINVVYSFFSWFVCLRIVFEGDKYRNFIPISPSLNSFSLQ